MKEKKIMKLASRGKRFGAGVIDAILPMLAYLVFVAVLTANGISLNQQPNYGYGYDYGYGYGYGYDYGYNAGSHLSGASAAVVTVVAILLLAYVVVEFVFFAKGKSIGKAVLGLQVVSSKDGKPFRFWKMVFRECIVKSASSSVLALGYIWILIDEKNRGWHDKILDSYVVDLRESEKMHMKKNLEQAQDMAYKAARTLTEPSDEIKPAKIEEAAEAAMPDPETAAAPVEIETEIPPVTSEEMAEASQAEETISDDMPAAGAKETEQTDEVQNEAVPNMSMKKEELLKAARERGITISSRATKALILEALEKDAMETPSKDEESASVDAEPEE